MAPDREEGAAPEDSAFAKFAVVPSNIGAAEAATRFASGLQTFVAIVGPSGWGKSHLLEAAAARLRCLLGQRDVLAMSAVDWVAGVRGHSPQAPLILDNVQDVLSKTRSRLRLRLALERRVRAGRPTLLAFTESSPNGWVRQALPQTRAWSIVTISPPRAAEREVVVLQMAGALGLVLSDTLRRLLAWRLDGNGRTLLGALRRLRARGAVWLDGVSTLRACGLLNPFFVGDANWDLRDAIHDVARSLSVPGERGMDERDLAVCGMLHFAELSETDVARYLGMHPGEAYHRALAAGNRLRALDDGGLWERRFVEKVLEGVVGN